MSDILMLNGPNLNLLGKREPEVYGAATLPEIEANCIKQAQNSGFSMSCQQSNSESELISHIHNTLADDSRIILFNPAGFTHTSVSLRDALLAVKTPFIEIHLSNPNAREKFRHFSFFSDIAEGVISGFGEMSYQLAVLAAIDFLTRESVK